MPHLVLPGLDSRNLPVDYVFFGFFRFFSGFSNFCVCFFRFFSFLYRVWEHCNLHFSKARFFTGVNGPQGRRPHPVYFLFGFFVFCFFTMFGRYHWPSNLYMDRKGAILIQSPAFKIPFPGLLKAFKRPLKGPLKAF